MFSSILSSALFAGLVSSQFQQAPYQQAPYQQAPYPQAPYQQAQYPPSQYPGVPKSNGAPTVVQPETLPMIIPPPDFQNFPRTRWCQILPIDAAEGYGLACQLGNNATVLEGDENTLLNVHGMTPDRRNSAIPGPYDQCYAWAPFACRRAVVDRE
jgi:hypothetical protein